MVAYCKDCKRYVNQYCEICGGNFGVEVCERFGCGGKMLCPICGGNNLSSKREAVSSPYDFKKEKRRLYGSKKAASEIEARYFEEKITRERTEKPGESIRKTEHERHCPLCGFTLMPGWKFCPECGVSLIKK